MSSPERPLCIRSVLCLTDYIQEPWPRAVGLQLTLPLYDYLPTFSSAITPLYIPTDPFLLL